MDQANFNEAVNKQVQRSLDLLVAKGDEYAVGDRLSNFKTAARLQDKSTKQALAGMMAKHTVSIYDMIYSDKEFDVDKWNEKITDHINYLLLLRAIIAEEQME